MASTCLSVSCRVFFFQLVPMKYSDWVKFERAQEKALVVSLGTFDAVAPTGDSYCVDSDVLPLITEPVKRSKPGRTTLFGAKTA
mmetsp:Transcript_52110/g.137859  ORF Transcript_52110/g.137859 Transcript_52110/m.137859 type:complete len:84 (-) Transcript_52110:11-262(-)